LCFGLLKKDCIKRKKRTKRGEGQNEAELRRRGELCLRKVLSGSGGKKTPTGGLGRGAYGCMEDHLVGSEAEDCGSNGLYWAKNLGRRKGYQGEEGRIGEVPKKAESPDCSVGK